MSKRYTDECVRQAVASNHSIAGVLRQLGLKAAGGNYVSIKRAIERLNISTLHFRGQCWNRGLMTGPTKPIEEYLRYGSGIQSHRLKKRLIKESIKRRACEGCGMTGWLGRPIPLELDHVNGDSQDNRLLNLRLLCPNCHALTPTYRGKNIGCAGRVQPPAPTWKKARSA